MTKKTRRLLTPEEFNAMFPPEVIQELIERSKTMGPYEADPSTLSPEEGARLDRWVEGYCASGHDPDYVGPDY
jgi:hypothetical protein